MRHLGVGIDRVTHADLLSECVTPAGKTVDDWPASGYVSRDHRASRVERNSFRCLNRMNSVLRLHETTSQRTTDETDCRQLGAFISEGGFD